MQGPKPTIRRDDRAEPDDDDEAVGSSRINVVSVDSVRGGDTATSGMVALRRELAKLNQQAAAVEKSLDNQRRERSESLERLEKERLHAVALEARIAGAEAEAAALRKAHELAIVEMRAAHETSLAELRKAREERAAFEKAAEAAKAAASEVQAKTAKDEAATRAAQDEAAKRAAELAKVNAELARVKEEHARNRATARERIAVLERAADEASAVTQRTQSELDTARQTEVRLSGEAQAARQNADLLKAQVESARQSAELLTAQVESARQSEERLGHQLEAALARAAEAESQALTISLSHASLEGSLRTLRDEVTDAFARVGTQAAAAAAISSSRMLPITADLTDPEPDSADAAPEVTIVVPERSASAPPSGSEDARAPRRRRGARRREALDPTAAELRPQGTEALSRLSTREALVDGARLSACPSAGRRGRADRRGSRPSPRSSRGCDQSADSRGRQSRSCRRRGRAHASRSRPTRRRPRRSRLRTAEPEREPRARRDRVWPSR